MSTKNLIIIQTVEDLVVDFLYYNRKEDDELPVGVIEEAIKCGDISCADIIDVFSKKLINSIKHDS